jgi:hypothetical protein
MPASELWVNPVNFTLQVVFHARDKASGEMVGAVLSFPCMPTGAGQVIVAMG